MGRKPLHVISSLLLLLALLAAPAPAAAAADPCAPHLAGLKLVQAEIRRHNASMPPPNAPTATINAYNREADMLNKAQADSLKAVRSCWAVKPGQNSAVWKLKPHRRGFAIERMYGENLPNNFPTIDRFVKKTGTATSIKSIDLRKKSYAKRPKSVRKLIEKYVDSVAGFAKHKPVTYSGVTISPGQVKRRQLLVAVPEGRATSAHHRVFKNVRIYAKKKKVKVIYKYVR